jgi:hypothetical protein
VEVRRGLASDDPALVQGALTCPPPLAWPASRLRRAFPGWIRHDASRGAGAQANALNQQRSDTPKRIDCGHVTGDDYILDDPGDEMAGDEGRPRSELRQSDHVPHSPSRQEEALNAGGTRTYHVLSARPHFDDSTSADKHPPGPC